VNPGHPTFTISLKKLLAAVTLICCELAVMRLWIGRMEEVDARQGYLDFGEIALTLLMGLAIIVTVSHVVVGWTVLAIGFRGGGPLRQEAPTFGVSQNETEPRSA
jgi:hypothetical protein